MFGNMLLGNRQKNPSILAYGTTAADTLTTTHSWFIPTYSGVAAGDYVVVYYTVALQAATFNSISFPVSYTQLLVDNAASFSSIVIAAPALTNLSGGTVSFTTNVSTNYSSMGIAIVRGATLGVRGVLGPDVSSSSFDMGSITPDWGQNQNAYLLFARNATGAIGRTATAPSGYSKLSENAAGGVTTTIFGKTAFGTTENPAAFSWNTSGNLGGALIAL